MKDIAAQGASDSTVGSIDLASWNRPRSLDELRAFVASHHDERLADIEL